MAMTDEEITAAALADPDARPLTPEQLARMKRTSPVKRRRASVKASPAIVISGERAFQLLVRVSE
jgi:hypothetical protein